MKRFSLAAAAAVVLTLGMGSASAADYKVDIEGAHAFINFKFKHLGYSVLAGTFKKFDGEFTWDPEAPEDSTIAIDIDVTSLDSNHAERDKHIRDEKYLNTDEFPTARFESTRVEDKGDGKLVMHGNLTLRGVTRPIAIKVSTIGEGDDPWGGYRAGFEGYVTLNTKEFGMETFRPLHQVDMELYIEGKRAK